MGVLWQDMRYGFRMLAKKPGFTIVAVLTLALGIGANTAIFSVIDGVLLRPLRLGEPDRLVRLWELNVPRALTSTLSVPNLKDWREQNTVFTGIAAYHSSNFNLQTDEAPLRIPAANVTADFFNVLGVQPQLGRAFAAGDDAYGAQPVAVVSDRLWRNTFGGDPAVVGRTVPLDGAPYTIIGVMPPHFRFPSATTDLWVPLAVSPKRAAERGDRFLYGVARLKDGITVERAQEEMRTIAARLSQQYPEEQADRSVRVTLLQYDMTQNVRPALLMLFASVSFVLLIACTNVANLLLAHAAARRREIAIRAALGAGRFRLVRQFVAESLMLSGAGGALGLLFAWWGVDALLKFAASSLPRAAEVGLDWRVLVFTVLISIATGVAFGLAPAFEISRTDLQGALKEGGSAGSSPRGNWLRSLLVVTEVAASVVLLIGAGLLLRSFLRLQQTDLGLQPRNVFTMRVALPQAKYQTPEAAAAFYAQTLERVSSLPGVEAAGAINFLPLQQTGFSGGVLVEGQPPPPPGQEMTAEYRSATPDFFRALGIPVVAGRTFKARDRRDAQPVAIVNRTFVERYMPNQDPVGKRIRTFADWMTVVGVVGDVKQGGLARPIQPEVYIPPAQNSLDWLSRSMALVVRSAGDAGSLAEAVRREVQAVDPAIPVFNVQTMESIVRNSVTDQRLNVLLVGLFAGVALLLAVIGVYGVVSYTVTQGTREFGIRMALGAQRSDVLTLVVGRGMTLALFGVGVGFLCSLALTRFISGLLFGVKATDPLIFAGVPALFTAVVLLACLLPARRATKVDPMVALRYE